MKEKITSYKDLEVWRKSIVLVKQVYFLTSSFPNEERFGITSQMRRAAVSIPSNIAEGWGRFSTKNYIQFLKNSRGSLFELETLLTITIDLEYHDSSQQSVIAGLMVEIGKMLNAIIVKLEQKEQ